MASTNLFYLHPMPVHGHFPESFVVMEQNSRRTYTKHGCAGGGIQDHHTAKW